MPDLTQTRRHHLRSLGSAGLAWIPFGREVSTDSTTTEIDAENLLLPASEVPTEFRQVESPSESPAERALRNEHPVLSDAETAVRHFVAGDDPDVPEWVFGSLAVVCDQTPPRSAVKSAVATCHDTYHRSYDQETDSSVNFESTESHWNAASDWQLDIWKEPATDGLQEEFPSRRFTDLLRVQYCGPVILGTLVFGPQGVPPDIHATVTRHAILQRGGLRREVGDA